MTIQQLKYIIGVSETGSINKAAEILYVSQPSLTAAIKDVENEFNITIFNRSSKGITLTSEGKEFIQYGRQIYAQYDSQRRRRQGWIKKKKAFCSLYPALFLCRKIFRGDGEKIRYDGI